MTPFTDKAARTRVAALDTDFRRLDTGLATLNDQLAAARLRRDALTARLNTETAQPGAPDSATDDLAARLAADPAAAIDDKTAALLRDSRSATAFHDQSTAGLHEAIGKALASVDQEIAGLEGDIAAGTLDRANAWAAFVRGAHEALADELVARWAMLERDVVAPMMELADVPAGFGLTRIVSGANRRISEDSKLALGNPGAGQEHLFRADLRRRQPEVIEALRAALAS